MTLHLLECSEKVVLPLVFAQKSKAEVLESENLRQKIFIPVSSIQTIYY